jgi:hypothetical protein
MQSCIIVVFTKYCNSKNYQVKKDGLGGAAPSVYVVGGTIPRTGDMGGTTTIMGQIGYPYRVLVKNVNEETDYKAG